MRPAALQAEDVAPLHTDRDRLDLQDWVIDRLAEEFGATQTT
jgi:hypothetical protein